MNMHSQQIKTSKSENKDTLKYSIMAAQLIEIQLKL